MGFSKQNLTPDQARMEQIEKELANMRIRLEIMQSELDIAHAAIATQYDMIKELEQCE